LQLKSDFVLFIANEDLRKLFETLPMFLVATQLIYHSNLAESGRVACKQSPSLYYNTLKYRNTRILKLSQIGILSHNSTGIREYWTATLELNNYG
jgi:hypothetical protein